MLIFTFRLLSSWFHYEVCFSIRSSAPLLRRGPAGGTRRRIQQRSVSQSRRSSTHRPADWSFWEIDYGVTFLFFTILFNYLKLIFPLDCISGGFRIAVDVHANLDLQEPQLQLAKQIANIVDHRHTFLVKVDKVSLYWMKKFLWIIY